MKTLSRTLAMLVSFQLLIGCNDNKIKINTPKTLPKVNPVEEFVEISGSIARIMNFIIPTAAAAEGKLSVIDVSNPDDPKEVTTYDITGTDSFSLKVKKEELKDRILKVQYDSYEGDEKSRTFLFNSSDYGSTVDASLDEDKSLKAKILEAQLKVEYGRGHITNHDEMKKRFGDLKDSSVDDELELAGDKTILMKLMLDAKIGPVIAEYLAVHRLAVQRDDVEEIKGIEEKLNYFLLDRGLIKDGVLKCAGNAITFSMLKEREFNVYGEAYDEEVRDMFGGKDHLAGFAETGKFDEVMKNVQSKLNDLAQNYGKNLSATITVVDEDQNEQSCRLYAWEIKEGEGDEEVGLVIDKSIMASVEWQKASDEDEAYRWVSEAYEKTIKILYENMLKEGIKEDSEEWNKIRDAQIPEAKKLNESIHNEIYNAYHSMSVL